MQSHGLFAREVVEVFQAPTADDEYLSSISRGHIFIHVNHQNDEIYSGGGHSIRGGLLLRE